MKTSELIGPALDWAVAKCKGFEVMLFDDLWRANAQVKGYLAADVEEHLGWQPQRGRYVIVELRQLQLDQRNPDVLTPTRCAKDIPDYSTDWSQGGPIIERECIATYASGACSVSPKNPDYWVAEILDTSEILTQYGPTPLIAAMRAFVASRLGDEVEIPEELK